ncbi:uncharacterized protein MKK02DRAFT_41346 [Dioszegia hungarica]|uniref:Swi5-domain-containing protein n=1 Tax=Dioszegia hungarica TaxID=4972 RepID=A0AA38H003_9TREE|nr:uncharacterized protein MKK02DRAFT_41346 [Dioszegia hungarica]KAI9631718.1 hypothetical protein MKK02DRAFT_41346 [Dioszegia hungarica]
MEDPRIVELKERIAKLKDELGPGLDPNAIVARHIKLLHTYNETKDTSQMLIAIYGRMTQKTVTQLHTELGLPLSE